MLMSYLAVRLRSPRRGVLCVKILPMLVVLAWLGAGCAAPKRTWQQWMTAAKGAPAQASPGLPELPSDTHPPLYRPSYRLGDGASVGPYSDLAARNPGFPATYISVVQVDLTAPSNSLHLTWAGPDADLGPTGPWRSSAGRGKLGMDCDDVEQSNTVDSWCTPKGAFPIAGFDDCLESAPYCRYVTWVIHEPRFIAIHSHTEIPPYPASHGCIRVPVDVAKLIHNNSLAGVTRIHIYGKWTRVGGLVR